jgi:hypothetical protein
MNKQESQNLMIGSWVLAGGEPRQVSSLTTKKAGFKRGTSGHRDFFRFDQLQGIPLSEELLKECITYRDINPKEPNGKVQSIHCYSDTVIALHTEGRTEYHRFRYLHEVQAFLGTMYQLQVVLDLEKYKWLREPSMLVSREQMLQLSNQVSGGAMKGTSVQGESLRKTLEAMGIKDGNKLVRNHIPEPNLEKDERGLVKGMLTYKDIQP